MFWFVALSFLQKKKHLFSMGSNNSLLELIVEGTPQVKEYFLDSKKEVDKQLKLTCEQFISHCTVILIGPLKNFITKVQDLCVKFKTSSVFYDSRPREEEMHFLFLFRHPESSKHKRKNLTWFCLSSPMRYQMFSPS